MSTTTVVLVSVAVLGVVAVTAYGIVLVTGHLLDGAQPGAPTSSTTSTSSADPSGHTWWNKVLASGERQS